MVVQIVKTAPSEIFYRVVQSQGICSTDLAVFSDLRTYRHQSVRKSVILQIVIQIKDILRFVDARVREVDCAVPVEISQYIKQQQIVFEHCTRVVFYCDMIYHL